MYRFFLFAFAAISGGLLFVTPLSAQDLGNAPYSAEKNIGQLNSFDLLRNSGMGGAGVSTGRSDFINLLNPALLYHNSRAATFELGLSGQQNEIRDATTRQRTFGANLNYLALSFPVIANRGAVAVGLTPYSTVNYQISFQNTTTDGSVYRQELRGQGGLNRVFLSMGGLVWKNLSAGIEGNYVFGSTTRTQTLDFLDAVDLALSREVLDRTSDVTIKAGLSWQQKVGADRYVNFGLTYDPRTDLNMVRELRVLSRVAVLRNEVGGSLYNYDDIYVLDSLERFTLRREGLKTTLPATGRFGVGFSQAGAGKNYWNVAVDLGYRRWTTYRDPEGNGQLADAYNLHVGAEWLPSKASLPKYYERITYRLGVRYAQMPMVVSGEQLDDVGINFGFTLPINKNLAGVSGALTLGQRGTTDRDLIQERYIRFSLGFSLSDTRWFRRYRLD
ncbi:MAG: hypothetical protein WBA12_00010 [Catalinimonas sp.]